MLLTFNKNKIETVGNNQFYAGDNKDLFEQNLKRLPFDWPWRTKNITYKLNSQYYRAPEWSDIDWNNSYIVFGCSNVFGMGINYTDTFTHHLSELLECPTINLGVPGASPLVQWLNTITLIENNIKPKGAIYLWPNIYRTTKFDNEANTDHQGTWSSTHIQKHSIGNAHHCLKMTSLFVNSVDLMWSCPTYHFHLTKEVCDIIKKLNFIKNVWTSNLELARDYEKGGAHPGPKSNLIWANQMYDIIKQA